MRIYIPFFFMCLLLTGTTIMADTLQVQTGSTPLREMPSFLAGTITSLSYGQPVEVLAQQGDWRRVKVAGTKTMGWVHTSALTDRKIELASGDALSGGVSSDELALAGKGFSPEVEAAFRAENRELNYAEINRMETFRISPETAMSFLREGGLRPEGGSR